MRKLLIALWVLVMFVESSIAEGNPTRRAQRLEPLLIDGVNGFSNTRFEVDTGVYYRWRIVSDGLEEYRLLAPRLFRESWIDKVTIDDMEIEPFGLHSLSFDDGGEIDIWFIPQRPGEYGFSIEGLETQGFKGMFVVK